MSNLTNGIKHLVEDILAQHQRPYSTGVFEQTKGLQTTAGLLLVDNGDGTAQIQLKNGTVITAFFGAAYRFPGDPVFTNAQSQIL